MVQAQYKYPYDPVDGKIDEAIYPEQFPEFYKLFAPKTEEDYAILEQDDPELDIPGAYKGKGSEF